MSIELDHAHVGRDQSHDHVENSGLSGAVRTQQADGLASPNGNADVLNDHPALVPFAEIMDCEQPLPAGSVPSGVFRRRRLTRSPTDATDGRRRSRAPSLHSRQGARHDLI